MSIVTYDGKVLAADSRKTTSRTNQKTGIRETVRRTDQQVKIELMGEECKFRGETVRAVGRCGNLKLSSAIIEDIKRQIPDLEEHWRLPATYRSYTRPASVLILTDRNAYHFRVSPAEGLSVTVLERKPFAMGSGKEVAEYLMSAFKLPAHYAAAAVTLMYKSCGGPIRVVRRDIWTGQLQLSDAKEPKNRDELRIMVAKALIRAAKRMKTRAEERLAAAQETKVEDPAAILSSVIQAIASSTAPVKKRTTGKKKASTATKKPSDRRKRRAAPSSRLTAPVTRTTAASGKKKP